MGTFPKNRFRKILFSKNSFSQMTYLSKTLYAALPQRQSATQSPPAIKVSAAKAEPWMITEITSECSNASGGGKIVAHSTIFVKTRDANGHTKKDYY